jgi:hypothetical protein
VIVSLILQVLIVEFGGKIFHVEPLDWRSWYYSLYNNNNNNNRLICTAFGSGSLPIGFLIRSLPSFGGKRDKDDELLITEEETQSELADLHRIVVDSQEASMGRSLTLSEKQNWMTAINHSANQLRVMGGYSYTSRSAFREGVLIGARMAVEASPPSIRDTPLEKVPSRGKELWAVAGNKVRRQVTVIDAFRRHRRDNTFLHDSGDKRHSGSSRASKSNSSQ